MQQFQPPQHNLQTQTSRGRTSSPPYARYPLNSPPFHTINMKAFAAGTNPGSPYEDRFYTQPDTPTESQPQASPYPMHVADQPRPQAPSLPPAPWNPWAQNQATLSPLAEVPSTLQSPAVQPPTPLPTQSDASPLMRYSTWARWRSPSPSQSASEELTVSGIKLKIPNILIPDFHAIERGDGATPQGNNAVHLAVLHDLQEVASSIARKNPRLLASANENKDTPLHIAAAAGRTPFIGDFLVIASNFEQQYRRELRSEGAHEEPVEKSFLEDLLMKKGRNGGTPLHEAMRHQNEDAALLLVDKQPDASSIVDGLGYSVLYLAVLMKSQVMVNRLLGIESSSHMGPQGSTAMHAAVLVDDSDIGRALLQKRPNICTETSQKHGYNPLHNATFTNKKDMVKIILEYDKNVIHSKDITGNTAVHVAAISGHLDILKEFLKQCPESGFALNNYHQNILVVAFLHQQPEVINYVLQTESLCSLLINQPDIKGNTPLHWAAYMCNPKLLRLLLADPRVNKLASNRRGQSALDIFYSQVAMSTATDWKETFMILDEAVELGYPLEVTKKAKERIKENRTLQADALTNRYVQSTTIVSALMATVTFAAAFTVPGGFISDSKDADKGTPILLRSLALKAFVISDVIAMCSSLAATFLCIYASWEDLNYLLHYREYTKVLMWMGFVAVYVAFATGMYAVLAPNLLWLAILVCGICCSLPFVTYVMAEWPMIKMKARLRRVFLPDIIKDL